MIRAANHSSFPRVGDTPLDQELRTALKRRERAAATDADVAAACEEVTTVCVAQQSRAFIDVVTDGMVRWDGPLSHLVEGFDGLSTAELYRWFETNFYERRVEVTGELHRAGPFLVEDFEIAHGVAPEKVVKVVLPGPVTFARLARDRHYGRTERLAGAVAELLGQEVAALAAAGARCFQLDEPLLCRHAEDLELVARCAETVFAAAGTGVTVLSTYFGDLSAIGDRLDRLPVTHLGLDMTAPANWPLLSRLPPGCGVHLGLFDARTTRQEDAADVAALLEPHREILLARDLMVGPNAGLELLPRDQAFDKLLHARYLVEALVERWG